ncbi:MAG: SAM-dependent methyltransferase [Bacteroidetes bacterium]|nr:SAM-dependent methyltransferase [Bacteroidota bacterium]
MKKVSLYTRMSLQYLQFFYAALTKYDVHAPFVYQLLEEVVEDDRQYYIFDELALLRQKLQRDRQTVTVTDYGAGSMIQSAPLRSVKDIARYSAVPPSIGELLFRLVLFCRPGKMLELGSSLGISAIYQAAAARKADFITIEGDPTLAKMAAAHLNQLGLPQVDVWQGPFAERLPEALQRLSSLDYLYLDGDHRAGASMQYFETCLPYAHADSVFVIADIYWSREMQQAWQRMCAHEAVRLSVDLFDVGLLFFRKEQHQRAHYKLLPAKYKPWRMGFWG